MVFMQPAQTHKCETAQSMCQCTQLMGYCRAMHICFASVYGGKVATFQSTNLDYLSWYQLICCSSYQPLPPTLHYIAMNIQVFSPTAGVFFSQGSSCLE